MNHYLEGPDLQGQPLTPREAHVLELYCGQGLGARAIEGLLRMRHGTLDNHLKHAGYKLAPGRGRAGLCYEYGRRAA